MTSSTTPELRHWTAARDGKPISWSEDAWRAEWDGDAEAWSAILVVADGAGSTAFAGEWACALVEAALPGWLDGNLGDAIAQVRERFDPLEGRAHDEDEFLLTNRWYERGSASTLMIAHATHERSQTRCRVVAVGDCIAAVATPDRLETFPLQASHEFRNWTTTVRTTTSDLDVSSWTCDLPPGCLLAVASDGIGRWLLALAERDGPAQAYERLRNFSDLEVPDVEDDVTLLLLDVPGT